ncbi:MAG TPA: ATP-binding protein, partial [Kofleriaceae bacterium]|nr:ATP-binding protein [Kofleriaceae bacterium]
LLLLLVAGPTLWGELARLYGILGNDDDRPLVDEMLLVQIVAGQIGRHDIARELDRGAPLVRYGLVLVDDSRQRPFAALACDPIALGILRADRTIDAADLRPRAATCAFDDLWIPAATKDAIVRGLATARAPARIVIRGRAGSGRHTTLAALADRAGRKLAVIDASTIVLDLRNQLGRLRAALCRAHLLGMLPCIDGLEGLAGDDRIGRAQLAAVIDAHPGPVAVRLPWDAQPPLDPGYVGIDLPALSLAQRTACWRGSLDTHGVYVREPDELADRYGIGPGTIDRVCARVGATVRSETEMIDRSVELETAIRQHLETGLRATATRVERLATWSRVVLPPDIQDSVLELIARIKHRRTVYDAWGYDQVLTTSRGVTALFQGAPGTGKTLVASAIANELGMDLYRVDLSRVMSKWIGETEQNLAKLFDAAEDGHAIILFDEADSLFAKRTEVRSSVDRYANLEVNNLLQRLVTFEGIAILTTNFGTSIDQAFKRRLSFRLTFPFPDEDAREQLWRAHLAPSVPKAGTFDLAELARRYRLSGGYIRNAAVRAAFLAAEEHASLTQDHLVRAIQAEFREIGKIAETGVLE